MVLVSTSTGFPARPLAAIPSLPVEAMWFPSSVSALAGGLKKLAMIPCPPMFGCDGSDGSPTYVSSTSSGVSTLLIPSFFVFTILEFLTVSMGAPPMIVPLSIETPVAE